MRFLKTVFLYRSYKAAVIWSILRAVRRHPQISQILVVAPLRASGGRREVDAWFEGIYRLHRFHRLFRVLDGPWRATTYRIALRAKRSACVVSVPLFQVRLGIICVICGPTSLS